MAQERGYVLISVGVAAIALLGAVGLAIDLGRMYIAKGEAQTFADSAALAAVLELDGTSQGIDRAKAAVAANANRYGFGLTSFTNSVVEFATSSSGPWSATSGGGGGTGFVRVTATAPVPVYFLALSSGNATASVSAVAAAGQVPKTGFGQGLFPFSPYAHTTTPPDFGLQKGTLYTLRWPSNPKLGNNSNICQGDQTQDVLNLASAAGGSERGYIEDTSANIIRATIIDDVQSVFRSVGDLVNMTGGTKQSQLDSLYTRILQDSDTTATTYQSYTGNGRRIIVAPINDGGSNPVGTNNRILGFGAFFLVPTGQYGNGGGQAWCAEFIGCWLQGANNVCAMSTGSNAGGAYVARLVI